MWILGTYISSNDTEPQIESWFSIDSNVPFGSPMLLIFIGFTIDFSYGHAAKVDFLLVGGSVHKVCRIMEPNSKFWNFQVSEIDY